MSQGRGPSVRSKSRKGSVRATTGRNAPGPTVTLKTKSGQVTIGRHSQTGRFTAIKSAKIIDGGVVRFAASLKRLATK